MPSLTPAIEPRRPPHTNAVFFKPDTHEYFVEGVRVPGVSEILAPLNKLDGVPAGLLERAREFGTHVHLACELFDKGVLDEAILDPALAPYLQGWKQFLFDTKAVVSYNERVVYHRQLQYCGTLDRVVEIPDRKGTRSRLVDIKSGIVPRSAGAQTAAYEHALRSERGTSKMLRCCVQLSGDGRYKIHKHDRDIIDWNLFLSCLNIYKHLTEKSQ